MTKQLKLTLISLVILAIWFIAVWLATNNKSDSDSRQIADLEYQMNELRKTKEKCFDDLTRKETQEYLSWFTQPCVQYDEQIMALREKADNLKTKSYEVGLYLNR